jgi:hypothetical protein
MTLRQFGSKMDAFNDREKVMRQEADLRAGVIAATLWNTAAFRGPGSEDRKPSDFFASLQGPAEEPRDNPHAMHAAFLALVAGKIQRAN